MVAAAAAPLVAQGPSPGEDRAFVTVNVGAQPQRRNFETSASFPVFGETAAVSSRQHVGNGPMVDVNGGYRIWNRVAVGVGVSSFHKSGGSLVAATVPDPLFFNRPRVLNAEVSDLAHSERAVYLQVMYAIPIARAMEVALTAGPSFIQVSQQLVTTATIGGPTPSMQPVVETQRKLAAGINAGIEVSYLVAARFNPIVFARFNGGTVNLPSVRDLKVGGLQTGIGGRFRF
jgi:hypothetical protein